MSQLQLSNFDIQTIEDAYGLQQIEIAAKFTLHTSPGKQIVFINSGIVKDILGKVVKQAVQLDEVMQMPAVPPAMPAKEAKNEENKDA